MKSLNKRKSYLHYISHKNTDTLGKMCEENVLLYGQW